MSKSIRHPRAFTMVEMLLALILIGVFALSATKLFSATMKLSRNTAAAQNTAASFNSALAALRADVWRARKIETLDRGIVILTLADMQVQWSIDEQIMRSKESGDQRVWEPPTGTSLHADATKVILRVPPTTQAAGGEIWVASQPLLIEKMTQ